MSLTVTPLLVAFRSSLTLLLLLNYLLVVGAGLVERPAPTVSQPFAYVHNHDCQVRNSLRIGCFDDCNGVQYVVKKTGERLPLQHLLTTLKSLDLHCLPEAQTGAAKPFYAPAKGRLVAAEAATPSGHRGLIEIPPRRG